MASFFQPAVYDPNAETSETSNSAVANSRFLIYTNSTLFGQGILDNWYQFVVLAVGGAALAIPLIRWTSGWIWKSLKGRRIRKYAQPGEVQVEYAEDEEDFVVSAENTIKAAEQIAKASSFGLYLRGSIDEFLALDYDIHIVDFGTCCKGLPGSRRFSTTRSNEISNSVVKRDGPELNKNIWALVDEAIWEITTSTHETLAQSVDRLKLLTVSQRLAGLVISASIGTTKKLNKILHLLSAADIPCMLLDEAADPNLEVNTSLLCGVIYKNACILGNGLRRDFFQASKLRSSLSQYEAISKRRPTFFTGFLDLWASTPLPSVIRRSYKFAKFHGAVLHHEAAGGTPFQAHNTRAWGNALSAFDWLKRDDIVEAQRIWSTSIKPQEIQGDVIVYETQLDLSDVEAAIPGIGDLFTLSSIEDQPDILPEDGYGHYEAPAYLDMAPPRENFWTSSSQGELLCNMGCFDLREELFADQYTAIVKTQNHLLRLGMLETVDEKVVKEICTSITHPNVPSSISKGVLLNLSAGLLSNQIKIFRGLDSGFCLPDSRGHFWAVTDVDEDGILNIFVSLKTIDFNSTVVHAFLAHRGVHRRSRFDIEMHILTAGRSSIPSLHPRLQHELETATYAELLHMLGQITVAQVDDPILIAMKEECEKLLIDETSNRAWIEIHSHEYLASRAAIDDVLLTRLAYLVKRGSQALPQLIDLAQAFWKLDEALRIALYESDESKLTLLSQPLIRLISRETERFDDCTDLYCLMFFCSIRRLAFDEVYLETTDRCPLFLQQHDQAAVFAELWVLGSQCEKYFGIKPRALGAIIYDEYRDYLHVYPPSSESWNGVDVFTAYHKVKNEDLDRQVAIGSDVKPNATPAVPLRARLAKASFLTIFCVPAIVDVGLLTFLGRGLYLTAFMTLEERVMANYAVLAALIMTAGVTGWSGSTGGFYLHQSAFHNMNHFMVGRLAGGLMIAILLAVCGFIAFGIEYSWYGGFIFVAYLMVLSTYLNLLGIMTTMHRDGAPFKSGRTALAQSMLITLASPIITTFVNGHDVLIYLLILYTFLTVLLFNYSRLCLEWSSWPEKIPIVKEQDIIKWYSERVGEDNQDIEKSSLLPEVKEKMESKEGLAEAASAKLASLLNSKNPKLIAKDDFLKKIAIGHPYVVWLLEKESNGQPLPAPYTSTWLVQTKLALTNQQQLNRGLKEHSPFLLFRNAKYDLAQNVGLFLIALVDRWVAVSMSANGVVVNVYYDARARYGIAFGLLYFLLCAVSLDVVLQRYWGKTGRRSSEKLANIFDFEKTEAQATAVEKKRWFIAILELTWVMTFIFGLMTIFLWLFVDETNQIVLYFAYIVGYSGVIIFQVCLTFNEPGRRHLLINYQFNRVFTTDIRIHVQIVFLAAFGGYAVGVVLRKFLVLLHTASHTDDVLDEIPATQAFRFNDVIALCTASLSAAVGTWLYTDFCDDASQEVHIEDEDLVNWKVYSQKLIGEIGGQCSLRPDQLEGLQGIEVQFADSSVLSEGIIEIFSKALAKRDGSIHQTFSRAQEMLEYTMRIWEHDQLRLFIVDRKSLSEAGGASVFAASTKVDGVLMVYVGMPAMSAWRNITYSAYETLLIQLASEAMLHETCEAMMHLRHSDATLAELLLNGNSNLSTRMAVQLAWADEAEIAEIVAKTTVEMIRHLAIGIDPDTEWENTPEEVRVAVVARIVGRSFSKTHVLREWLATKADSLQLHDWYIRQTLAIRQVALQRKESQNMESEGENSWNFRERLWSSNPARRATSGFKDLQTFFVYFYETLFTFVQFVAIVSTAGTDCGRELWYTLRDYKIHSPLIWFILKIWKVCSWTRTILLRYIILRNDPSFKKFQEWTSKGASRALGPGLLTVSDPRYAKTGFLASSMNGLELAIYDGTHADLPTKQDSQIANYSSSLRLVRMSSYKAGESHEYENSYYKYSSEQKGRQYPISKVVHIDHQDYISYYDDRGRITHGDCLKEGSRYQFAYVYRQSVEDKYSTQILRATYNSVGLQHPVSYIVYWSRPGDNSSGDIPTWIPTGRVAKWIKTTTHAVQEVIFTYEHKRDPVMACTFYHRNGQQIQETEIIDKFNDDMGLTKPPACVFFEEEDLLIYHSKRAISRAAASSPRARRPSKISTVSRLSIGWINFSKRKQFVIRQQISTSQLRSALWRQWTARTDMNAVTTCLLDEMMLRKEPLLRRYWKLRDAGYFSKAKHCLKKNLDAIVASIEVADDASAKISLAIRPSDLFVMGLSKDSNYVITEPEETYIDTDTRMGVIFTDTGCWPDAPGGVSNCRRDLVDGHRTIRNYALTESANEYGIPRFQVEKNLQLVKNLPLWGLDGKSPCHGLFDNLLQTQVEKRIRRTRTKEDIENTFIPLLMSIVRGARTRTLSKKDLADFTKIFLNLNKYFEENDYLTTWRSKVVRKAWREAWLIEYADPNISNPNDSFDIEQPTGSDFDEALELYVSYFFIFSIKVPDKVPRVYQSTHHGISSLYGMILKIRRGTTWGIWDHAIMWRESCLNISPAQCILPVAVQSMLLGAMKLAANLAYTHADIILPCTAIYNP